MKYIGEIFLKMKACLKKCRVREAISIGIGGLISVYIIEYCRLNLIPALNGRNIVYQFIVDRNITSINKIEIFIILVSIIAIIYAPLLAKNSSKDFEMFLGIILMFMEIVCFMSVVMYEYITTIFILGTTITVIYLLWFIMGVLKEIYFWTRIEKSEYNQVDVTKLTFIWAVIVFILGLIIR